MSDPYVPPLRRFNTWEEAVLWACFAGQATGTRYVVQRNSPGWEAIQRWMRTM